MAQIIPFRRPERIEGTHPIPVTVVMGLANVGKSELIRSLVSTSPELRVGVLDDPKLTSEEGGCTQCGTRQDLLLAIKSYIHTHPIDCLIIEAAEDCDPQVIVDTFSLLEEDEPGLVGKIELDTLVCVVGAHRFWEDYVREPQKMDGLDAVELMVEQVELCDVIILNSGYKRFGRRSGGNRLDEIETILQTLQPRAKFLCTQDFDFASSEVLKTGLYDEQYTLEGAAWKQAVLRCDGTVPEEPVSSLVYKRYRPFHPERLASLIEAWPDHILRSYGQVWLASRREVAINLSQVGPSTLHFTPEGFWSERYLMDQPADPMAERYTEIAFVGDLIDAAAWISQLDSCLLTDAEMKCDWSQLSDPFPIWPEFLGMGTPTYSPHLPGNQRSYLKLVMTPPEWAVPAEPSPLH
ncbi:MAG: GTP-binding protein [Methylotenera sp.]|nr:GTP-binding protein [Oligoflexia bacterium]